MRKKIKGHGFKAGEARPRVYENTCKCGRMEMRTQFNKNMVCDICRKNKRIETYKKYNAFSRQNTLERLLKKSKEGFPQPEASQIV